MLNALRGAWRRLPVSTQDRLYEIIKPTGLPYCLSYLANSRTAHRAENFAGNLLGMNERYWAADAPGRAALSRQVLEIADHLILPNGVRKTTFAERHNTILDTILRDERFRLTRERVRVLDVPSSIGLACLDTHAMLSARYPIESYVMGDLYFTILYDQARQCIFDDAGNLLQVRTPSGRFYSVNRAHTSGDVYGPAARLMFVPLDMQSRYLKERYRYDRNGAMTPLQVVHPEAQARVAQGTFAIARMDVFEPITGQFDLILSFNLLQKNYFSPEQLAVGTGRLRDALADGGLLVLGNTEHFSVARKQQGALSELYRSGDF